MMEQEKDFAKYEKERAKAKKPKKGKVRRIEVELHDKGGATVTVEHHPHPSETANHMMMGGMRTSKAMGNVGDAHDYVGKVMGITPAQQEAAEMAENEPNSNGGQEGGEGKKA